MGLIDIGVYLADTDEEEEETEQQQSGLLMKLVSQAFI